MNHSDPLKDPNTVQLIEDYLFNRLEAGAKANFENRLQNDTSLRTAFNEFKMLTEGIEEQSMREMVEDFHQDLLSTSAPKKKPPYKYAVAAVALIAAALLTWMLFFNPTAAEKLYTEFYKPDPGLPTTMGATDNYEFYEGMVNYKNENYKEAISRWSQLYNKNQNNDTLTYFLGVAYLAEGHGQQADQYLQTSSDNTTSVFNEDALYYLALLQLKENKTQAAIKTLSKAKSERAKTLLERLQVIKSKPD